jgi:hypothetical protein
MRHLLNILVLVAVLHLNGKTFSKVRVPIVERRESVSAAFSHGCRYFRYVDVYLCLDVGMFSELLVKSDLDSSNCAFVGLRLAAVRAALAGIV